MKTIEIIRLVTTRELVTRGKSGAYIASTVITTLLLVGIIVLPSVFGGPDEYEVGVVGDSQAVIDGAEALIAAREDQEDERPIFEVTVFDDVASAEAAIEQGDIEVAVVDGEELVALGASGGFFGGSGLQNLLQEAANTLEVEELVATEGVDAATLTAILTGESLTVRSIGDVETEAENEARSVIAYGGLMLMYIAVLSYGTWTLTGVTEEKSNRVVEVLLSTTRPWHLLAGKILGIGLLGLAQFVVTVVAALVAARITGAFDLPTVPTDSALTLILWFVLGFLFFAVGYAMAGSLVSRMEDAQSVATPLSLIAIAGFFASFGVLGNPDGTLATVLTFLPPTAAFVVPIRVAFNAISGWEHALAALVTTVGIIGMIRIAGRVYAGGLLQVGTRVKVRDAWKQAEIR